MYSFIDIGLKGKTNESYILPYRVDLFFDYQNDRSYYFVYFLRTISVLSNAFLIAIFCLLVVLYFHCCGELSALQYKIKTLIPGGKSQMCHPDHVFKEILEAYARIVG